MSAAAHGRDNRVLHYAVLVSIILHGLALVAAPLLKDSSRRMAAWPGPLVARLVEPQAAPPEAAAKPEPAVKPAPLPKSPVGKAAPPEPAAPLAPPAAAEAPAAAAAVIPPSPNPVAGAEPQAAAPQPDAFDTGSLARYRVDVAVEARKYKLYPRAARDNNWEGRVVVGVAVRANGVDASYRVVRSSGHELLDQQAIEAVTKGRAQAQIPPALRGKEFSFEMTVTFDLTNP